jgi:hypothetical protein
MLKCVLPEKQKVSKVVEGRNVGSRLTVGTISKFRQQKGQFSVTPIDHQNYLKHFKWQLTFELAKEVFFLYQLWNLFPLRKSRTMLGSLLNDLFLLTRAVFRQEMFSCVSELTWMIRVSLSISPMCLSMPLK